MCSGDDPRKLFDQWAETYDLHVPSATEFPLAGYGDVLTELLSLAAPEPGMSVLDLGTGTGNLVGLFLSRGCSVWATDFSPGMIERARAKYPTVAFAVADLRHPLPAAFPQRYDRVTSAYAFHHLSLETKARRIRELALQHLQPGGRLLLADVAFRTAPERAAARTRYEDCWDPDEFYWAADETREVLGGLPLKVEYSQVSFCGGVFVIRPAR